MGTNGESDTDLNDGGALVRNELPCLLDVKERADPPGAVIVAHQETAEEVAALGDLVLQDAGLRLRLVATHSELLK